MGKREEARARKRIAEVMTVQGRKYNWLAQKTGYSRSHITEMMRGRAPMNDRFVKLAAGVLGITEESVFA
jgi:hypothetical protein